MFCIDIENSITWQNEMPHGCDVDSRHFENERQFLDVAERRSWTKQAVTDIWNGFAGTAGPFADLKPQKLFKNRPYGLAQIWKAIQRLMPSDAASEPAAPVADTVEDMPKKKAKRAKAKKVAAAEVEAKAGSNLSQLIAMIGRKNGASIEEIMAKTGWSATHTVRGRISILKSKGVSIESFKHETRGRVYRCQQ